MSKYLHTHLMRLRPGQVINRTANTPAVWQQAVALAKQMPHLDVNGNRIMRKEEPAEPKLVISSKELEIILPAPGRYTLHELWIHQPEPRSELFSFASSFGLFAKRNTHLVQKKKSKGYVKWVVLDNGGGGPVEGA